MGADVSRVRFDPLRDFSAVVLQQGRLLLDGDFNEYVSLLDRRLRAETCDLTSFGPDPNRAGVAWVPLQTPDAFRVTASGGGLTIGRGRMYVDGLLAESHGLTPPGFDPLLRERSGTLDTPYDQQPYWPTPDALPEGGPHLAYLDVWEREVTSLEDPGLVEVAVGVDTTARRQTAWQLRLLANIGNATCASDDDQIPGWPDVIAPSAGRLTTGVIDIAPTDDPCKLPPTGGYRGLENQTYRVEIHDPGAPGTATFKWSRDNGSVAIPVVEMVSATVLRLATVGKDDVLRVSTGDWVEILDDHYELGGKPGELRQVTVDDAERTITFASAIPADLQPADTADAAARHLRARRWDQAGVVRDATGTQLVDLDAPGAAGVIAVPAANTTQVVLENGIVVAFSIAAAGSGKFRAGDHWIVAARTADTSIEILDAAAPLGVQHHYARLGTVTFPDSETDCRRMWPPLGDGEHGCDCSVCVTPESHASGTLTLQAAVDLVKAVGGTVCLAAGMYPLSEPIVADGARSLRIHGQGIATVLVARGAALAATNCSALTVEDLAIVSGAAASAAVQLRATILADLHRLAILSYPNADGGGAGIELSGATLFASVRHNAIAAQVAIDGSGAGKTGVLGAALQIEDNVLVGFRRGIDLGGRSAYLYSCRVERNDVFAGAEGGIVATGAVMPGGALDVAGNKVATIGAGITVGPDATVESNVINALAANARGVGAAGLALGTDGIVVAADEFTSGPGHVRITGNRVHDRSGTGIAVRTAASTIVIASNVVADAGAGILIQDRGEAERAAVLDNEVLDIETTSQGEAGAIGIGIMRCQSVAVAGNRVARVGLTLVDGRIRAGIYVLASSDVRVTGNVVDGVGPTDGYVGLGLGIAVIGPFADASVCDNSARFSTRQPGPLESVWIALAIQSVVDSPVLVGNEISAVHVDNSVLVLSASSVGVIPDSSENAGVSSNTLAGAGREPTCTVSIRGDLVAQGNQCLHGEGEPITMRLSAATISAATNRVRGPKAIIELLVDPSSFAAVGNLAPGGTLLNGSAVPAPWQALNPNVP